MNYPFALVLLIFSFGGTGAQGLTLAPTLEFHTELTCEPLFYYRRVPADAPPDIAQHLEDILYTAKYKASYVDPVAKEPGWDWEEYPECTCAYWDRYLGQRIGSPGAPVGEILRQWHTEGEPRELVRDNTHVSQFVNCVDGVEVPGEIAARAPGDLGIGLGAEEWLRNNPLDIPPATPDFLRMDLDRPRLPVNPLPKVSFPVDPIEVEVRSAKETEYACKGKPSNSCLYLMVVGGNDDYLQTQFRAAIAIFYPGATDPSAILYKTATPVQYQNSQYYVVDWKDVDSKLSGTKFRVQIGVKNPSGDESWTPAQDSTFAENGKTRYLTITLRSQDKYGETNR